MARPVGPRKVTSVYQVAVPASLLREVGLDKGSEVYFLVSEAEPGAICIVPAERVVLRADAREAS